MFATIENGIITISRGDSFYAPICINSNTKLNPVQYTLQENDTLYFAIVEPNQSFENAIIKKVYDASSERDAKGNTLLKIETQDTEYLSAGKYYYTLKLKSGNRLTTLIQQTLFNIIGTSYSGIKDEYDDIDQATHIIYEGGELTTNGNISYVSSKNTFYESDMKSEHIIYEGGELTL